MQLQHHIPYFSDWSPLPYLANVLDVVLVAITLLLILRASRVLPVLRGVTDWLLIVLAVISANQLRRHALSVPLSDVFANLVPGGAHLFNYVRLVLIGALLLVLLWLRRDRAALARVTYVALLIVSPFALWGVGRALFEVVRGGPKPGFAGREFARESIAVGADKNAPRVVIVLFDMTDFGIAFARRPSSLRLPTFDALRHEAVFATNAVSPGDRTVRALPSLFTGTVVDSAKPIGPARLRLFSKSGQPAILGDGPTVFSELNKLGIRSSLVGWYHPYCTIFGALLESCWSAPVGGRRTLAEQMHDQARSAMGMALAPGAVRNWGEAHTQLVDLQVAGAQRSIAGGRSRLVFLHLAVPHWPWIYDRASRREVLLDPARAGGYLDNLALADSILAQLLQSVNDSRTSVIVTADHPFGQPPWRSDRPPSLTEDKRVPFIIRLAGQTQPLEYDRPTNTIILSSLTTRILEGKVRTLDELRRWLDAASVAITDSALAFRSVRR